MNFTLTRMRTWIVCCPCCCCCCCEHVDCAILLYILLYYILFYNFTKENSCGTQNQPHSILQYQPYGKPTQAAPINMALTLDADPNSLLSLHDQDQDSTDKLITKDIPFTLVPNKKEKPTTRTNTIPSFFQRHLLPPPPVTVATAVGNDHPEAPTTKKRISAAGSPQSSAPSTGQTLPTNLTFSFTWLCNDIPMAKKTPSL